MVAQAGQALAWPVSDDAGIPTPVWAITNERRNSVIAFLVVIGDLCYGAPKIQFTTQTYNIAKNTRNLRLGVHAYCSWTYLNGSPFGGFQQVYSDQNNVWYVSNYAWGNYESGGTISVTCLNLPGAGA